MSELSEDHRVDLKFADKSSERDSTSFIFSEYLNKIHSDIINKTKQEIIKNIREDFNKDFHVIDNIQQGFIIANIMMPFSIHIPNVRVRIAYDLSTPIFLKEESFNMIKKVTSQINVVLKILFQV